MEGLDIHIRTTHDFVQDRDVVNVSFTASFAHAHAQNIVYNTNFIERLSPQIKHIIDSFFDEYCMHVLLNRPNTSVDESTSTHPEIATIASPPSSRRVNESLGSSRRVMHEHHYQGQTCAVCHSGYKYNEFVRTLPLCKHIFHKRCIDPWIKRNHTPTCPICRTIIHLQTDSPLADLAHPAPTQTDPSHVPHEDARAPTEVNAINEAPSPSSPPRSMPTTYSLLSSHAEDRAQRTH